MIEWLRKRSLPARVLLYAAAAILAFMLAAGVGAMGALMLRGDLALPGREEPGPQEEEAAADQKAAAEAEYVAKVGDIQARAVETFLDSHSKLLRYDALTADDVDKMRANRDALGGLSDQAGNLDPPQKYGQQHETFDSAINELHEAVQLAYSLAADPTAATQYKFDEYDHHVNEATASLKKSNEMLGRDYKTINGVQRVSPLS